jgi:hypothetical protein
MPDVADLRARLTADTSDFKRGFADASVKVQDFQGSLQDLQGGIQEVNASVSQLGSVAGSSEIGKTAAALEATVPAAVGAAASIERVAVAGQAVVPGLASATRAAETVGRQFTSLALGADLSASRLTSLAFAGANLTRAFGDIQAAGGPGIFELLAGALEAATQSSSAFVSTAAKITSTVASLAPELGVAGLAVKLFGDVMRDLTKEAEASAKRIDEWSGRVADAINKTQEVIDKLSFEKDIGGLSAFDKETERLVKDAQDRAEAVRSQPGTIFPQGTLNAEIAKIRQVRAELQLADIWPKIEADSQKAGDAAQKAFQGIIDTFGQLDAASNFTTATDALARLQALSAEIHFAGPLSELTNLQSALGENAAQWQAWGKDTGASMTAVQSQIDETSAKIKAGFSEAQALKLTIDPAAAQRGVDDFVKKVSGVSLSMVGKLSTADAESTLAALRTKIAATPEGEFRARLLLATDQVTARLESLKTEIAITKLEATVGTNIAPALARLAVLKEEIITAKPELRAVLVAERDKLEAAIAASRANVEQGANFPLHPDTAEADAAIEDLRKRAQEALQPNVFTLARVQGGLPAGPEELKGMADQLEAAITSALKSGDKETATALSAQASAFLAQFGSSIRAINEINRNFGVSTTINVRALDTFKRIADLGGSFGLAGATRLQVPGQELGAAFSEFTALQRAGLSEAQQQANRINARADVTNALLRENTDIARANLFATQSLSSAISSGRFVQGIAVGMARNLRAATGNRSLKIGE